MPYAIARYLTFWLAVLLMGFRAYYRRREPDKTVLYDIERRNLGICLERARERSALGYGYPPWIGTVRQLRSSFFVEPHLLARGSIQ